MRQKVCIAAIFALSLMWGVVTTGFASEPLTVSSPDGNISISFG